MDFEKLSRVLPKDPIKWSTNDVGTWLDFIGISQFFDAFKQATIDGAILHQITDKDLVDDLGIKNQIIRKKILNWLSLGLKEYSSFLNKNKIIQNPQILMRDLPLNSIQQCQKQNVSEQDQKMLMNINFSTSDSDKENLKINAKNPNMIQQEEDIYDMKNNNINNENNCLTEESNPMCLEYQEFPINGMDHNQAQQPHLIRLEEQKNDNQQISEFDDANKQQITELIIQPSEGPQTNFYCINENGGKIGRHSSNQILILEESISRYHAEILFKGGEFFIKDQGSTTGTFIKIIDKLELQLGMIIEMGSNQFMIDKTNMVSKTQGELSMYVIEGPNLNQEYVLKFQNHNNYTIGRKGNNEISLSEDHHLSNIHSKLFFYDSCFWLEDMSSTNGSWRRLSKEGQASEPFLLNDKCIFKIGTTSTYICKKNAVYVNEKVNENACVICCEADRDALYLPCKHNTACIRCSKNLRECPICRTKIEDFIKIYKA